jgi:hypothetical protein
MRVDIDSVVLCTIEETLLELKREKISELISIRVAISHSTIDKAKYDESEVESMRIEIAFLKDQVNYHKGSHDTITKFIEDILDEDRSMTRLRRIL